MSGAAVPAPALRGDCPSRRRRKRRRPLSDFAGFDQRSLKLKLQPSAVNAFSGTRPGTGPGPDIWVPGVNAPRMAPQRPVCRTPLALSDDSQVVTTRHEPDAATGPPEEHHHKCGCSIRRHRRSPDLDRTRDPGPEPGQDRSPGQLTGAEPKINKTGTGSLTPRECRRRTSSGRRT